MADEVTSSASRTRGPDGDDALQSLLSRITSHEKAGAVMPVDLVEFGFFGSLIVIVTGLLALILPSATAIHHSHLFLVFGSTTASLDSFMSAAAIPAMLCGTALLLLDIYLMHARTSAPWRSAVVAQAAAGGVAGAICSLFLALLVLNLAIYLVIGMLILAALFAMLAGMAGS